MVVVIIMTISVRLVTIQLKSMQVEAQHWIKRKRKIWISLSAGQQKNTWKLLGVTQNKFCATWYYISKAKFDTAMIYNGRNFYGLTTNVLQLKQRLKHSAPRAQKILCISCTQRTYKKWPNDKINELQNPKPLLLLQKLKIKIAHQTILSCESSSRCF